MKAGSRKAAMFTAALMSLTATLGFSSDSDGYSNASSSDRDKMRALKSNFKCMKTGFTKNPLTKKKRNRRRYEIAFESRRRNRR